MLNFKSNETEFIKKFSTDICIKNNFTVDLSQKTIKILHMAQISWGNFENCQM